MVATALTELAIVLVSLLDELALLVLNPVDELCVALANGPGVFANSIRRKVLELLADQGSLNRTELAEAIAAGRTIPSEGFGQLTVGLHHNHLPRLDDRGYIDYDPRSGDAVLWKDPDEVRQYLESG